MTNKDENKRIILLSLQLWKNNNNKYGSGKSKASVLDLFGGVCGVMVIVVGNGHGDTSSNPERD